MNRSLMYGILTYECPYLHCCTYSITLTVCMVFAVHTVFAMRMSAEQLSYAWYIHMHPYLHCLASYGLCNCRSIQLPCTYKVVSCMVCMFPYLLCRKYCTGTAILCMVRTYVSISLMLQASAVHRVIHLHKAAVSMVIFRRYRIMYGVYVSISSLFIVVRYVWLLPYIRCLQYLMYGTYVCVYIYIALRMVRTVFAVAVRTGVTKRRSIEITEARCVESNHKSQTIHGTQSE